MTATPASPAPRSDVEVRVPADGAYVSVIRTTTAGLAARLDFTLDDVEDLRIVVGEACSLVIGQTAPGAALTAEFWLSPSSITIEVRTTAVAAPGTVEELDEDSFAWQVLTTLADDVVAGPREDGGYGVRLTHAATPLEPVR